MGGDVVSMSTAHEAVVARHCGMKVLAFSVVSNYVMTEYDDAQAESKMKIDHANVLTVVEKATPTLAQLLLRTLSQSDIGRK
jgi:purine-nucleoside phosphorylase